MKFQTYLIVVLVAAFFAVVGFGAYFVMMQSRLANELQSQPPTMITSPEESQSPLDETIAMPSATPAPTTPIANPATSPTPKAPQVIYEPTDNFSGPEKTQIDLHITEPFVLYYKEPTGSGNLVTLTIARNTVPESKGEFPYAADAVFDGGVTQGFLIRVDGGTIDSGGQVDWWVPECLMQCQFSDAFKASYPEIVAKATP